VGTTCRVTTEPAGEEANLSMNQRMRPRPRMLRNGFATNETEETGLRSKTKSKSKERNNRAHVSNKIHFFH
jgi:hypothetical protein